MIRSLKGKSMDIHEDTFIAGSADLVGAVTIGRRSSIWYGVVLRGDMDEIVIGECTNVQDNATLHVDNDMPCILGDYVTIGHNAVVHACTVGDNTMVGMGAVILNGAKIGRDSFIAAGALVTEDAVIPPGSLVVGIPGKVLRPLSEEEIQVTYDDALEYEEMWREYYKDQI